MTMPRASLSLPLHVLDLFSGAAGGWSLGLHRAGFMTIAACEIVEWRRILYSENFPHVRLYADIRDLTATRLVSDLGCLPDIVVGSPPCQDISSANTKGKGIEGERSGLYLEAVRLVGECRPRWFAFENSSNLRTRGADRLLDALEALGYACWPCVVGAADIGANHVRKRSWLIGCDPRQLADTRVAIPAGRHAAGGRIGGAEGDEGVGAFRAVPQSPAADADGLGRDEGRGGWRGGLDISAADDPGDAAEDGRGSRRPGRSAEPASAPQQPPCGDDGHADGECGATGERAAEAQGQDDLGSGPFRPQPDDRRGAAFRQTAAPGTRNLTDADQARQPHGRLESGLRPAQIADHGRGDGQSDGWCDDRPGAGQMGGRAGFGGDLAEPWPHWNGGLAHHIRVDDGVSAWLARTRIALGNRKGTSAASLIVEAFGDAVVPQIPEAIGRAILRSEAALNAVLGGAPASDAAADDSPTMSTVAGDAATDGDAVGNAPTDNPADHGGAS
ncbi:DNA cytosine methyltransferase [Paracoccus denitrificans]|jgi:DNA (cytosine-5)-methyltransferase 1|uniref:DNA (cytosine-5-)-methyltransferase n=1 Tax=Paracoccus denitrificans (strain Pd 1222) TaxID=318586 RepID=A1B7F1_PARDP|nr:DNA cytosine methyltransferase [Paracoccus denitrificans]ABL71445.1 C-5 cytosine-specific DNA methylase [Paracoccus denitrificans PD1222]MCU7430663.1 DNA cytosine methyltransferase [Paracoccus denitrificans]QAR28058.1 DNA cytosine methyltransferase [Paracoccus denitrificans]UPV97782.1 DNA cytosine methyltransferase [Paracoccus denitrificans]WQO35697.1 DNA cytosine methyltransferase [Paracoccus denitrificans]